MKNAVHVVDVPVAEDVRVLSEKRRQILPALLLVVEDDKLYKDIGVDVYDTLIDSLSAQEGFDIVRFTLRGDGYRTEVVRSFFDGDHGRPVLESICMLREDGTTFSTELYVRHDILANHKEPVPAISPINIPCNIGLAKELFFRQAAEWGHVTKGFSEGVSDLKEMLGDPSQLGLEVFVLTTKNRTWLSDTYQRFTDHPRPINEAANVAVNSIMTSIVKTIGAVINDEQLVLQASVVGLDALTAHSYVEDDLDVEDVYLVITNTGHNTKKLFIVFGAEDEADAQAAFVQEFELEPEHITPSSFKTVQFVYAN